MSKPEEPQRIAKLLARAGIASRREIERMIDERRIALNGIALETPATLLPNLRGVTVDGKPVAAPAPARLFRFHKPIGVLTAERDPKGRRTIYDVLPEGLPRVIPVGRLDLNTEGLLLLTTDGELKRQLELPATQVKRTYRARAFGEVSQAQLEDLIEGIEIEGVRYGSIDANLERRTGANTWIEMTLAEGKNREVRRVLEHLGLSVSRLIRTSYGPIGLGDMPVGAIDEVRQHDLIQFRRELRLPADKRSNAPLVTRARPDRSEEATTQPETPRRPQPSQSTSDVGNGRSRPSRDDAQRPRRARDDAGPVRRARKIEGELADRRPARSQSGRDGARDEATGGRGERRAPKRAIGDDAQRALRDRDEAPPAKAHVRGKAVRRESTLAARAGDKERGVRRDRDEARARPPRASKRPGAAEPRGPRLDTDRERGPSDRDTTRSRPRDGVRPGGKPRPGGGPRKGPR